MFVDLDWPLNASSLLSASAELLVDIVIDTVGSPRLKVPESGWRKSSFWVSNILTFFEKLNSKDWAPMSEDWMISKKENCIYLG